MTPILLQGDTVLGFLHEATSCVVTEERNGVYELYMTYPVTGVLFDLLAEDLYIKAKPNDTAALQLFRIYEITKPMAGIVTVKGEHVSYALAHYPILNVSVNGTPAAAVGAVLTKSNAVNGALQFSTTDTGWTKSKSFKFKVGSARAALGGTEGSLLDAYGGEYEFDNFNVKLHEHRGRDTGVVIAYRKNMTDIKVTTSMENTYTDLFAYAVKDGITYTSFRHVTNRSGIAKRILIRDFSSEFEQGDLWSDGVLQLMADAFLTANDINAISMHVTVSFVHLWQSPEYAELAALEKVSLCDTVTIRHEILGVDAKVKVIQTEYDCIAERYNKIELGTARANFSDTLRQPVMDVKNILSGLNLDVGETAINTAYAQAVVQATALMSLVPGGYVHFVADAQDHPVEIIVSDKEDYTDNTAEVWRWNMNGIGHSVTGYYGEYTTAITRDNSMVIGSIHAGTINANLITAGMLSSADGSSSFNLDTGLITASNINIIGGRLQFGDSAQETVLCDHGILLRTKTMVVGGDHVSVGGLFERPLLYADEPDAKIYLQLAYSEGKTSASSDPNSQLDGIMFSSYPNIVPETTTNADGRIHTSIAFQYDLPTHIALFKADGIKFFQPVEMNAMQSTSVTTNTVSASVSVTAPTIEATTQVESAIIVPPANVETTKTCIGSKTLRFQSGFFNDIRVNNGYYFAIPRSNDALVIQYKSGNFYFGNLTYNTYFQGKNIYVLDEKGGAALSLEAYIRSVIRAVMNN